MCVIEVLSFNFQEIKVIELAINVSFLAEFKIYYS